MNTDRPSMSTTTRVGLVVALAIAVGACAVGVTLGSRADAQPAAPTAVSAPASPPVAVPARPAPTSRPSAAAKSKRTTTTKPTPTTTSSGSRRTPSAAECTRVARTSPMANAELRPYLRRIGCGAAADGLLVGGAPSSSGSDGTDSEGRDSSGMTPGEQALQACRQQTGQTNAQCRAQMERGEAN